MCHFTDVYSSIFEQVGDIVKTYINEEFPCDMVLLSSEDHKGHCFITTANLDGETNLKVGTGNKTHQ